MSSYDRRESDFGDVYTTTITTPLANGVTASNLVKILHHHRTMIEVLAPGKTRCDHRGDPSTAPSLARTPTATATYDIVEPTSISIRKYAVQMTGCVDGIESLMSPDGAQMRVQFRVEDDDRLVEHVRIQGSSWNRRKSKKRLQGHAKQHSALMQLAATSKSMTGLYAYDSEDEEEFASLSAISSNASGSSASSSTAPSFMSRD